MEEKELYSNSRFELDINIIIHLQICGLGDRKQTSEPKCSYSVMKIIRPKTRQFELEGYLASHVLSGISSLEITLALTRV